MRKRYSAIVIYLMAFLPGLVSMEVENKDLVYDSNIQTVLLHPTTNQLLAPVISLNSTDKLRLVFDDMSPEFYQFSYTFIHCTEDWQTSDLNQMDYLNGFFEEDITQYEFSLNAIPPYIHYSLFFPTSDMQIKLSGNYILKVYLDSPDDENVIITRRFFVKESLVRVDVDIPYYPKNLEFVRKKQQIDLTLFTPDLFNAEPEQRVSVTIQQNGRWDNIKHGLKATSLMMDQLNFDYREGIVFEGGNEYRNFDMKSYYYQSMYIREIINDPDGYIVVLHTDYPRAKKPYSVLEDLNGQKYVKARPGQDTNIEGEYAWVEFSLKHPRIKDADVYIMGALSNWQLDENSKMRYDNRYNMYTGRLYLKQGYYNFLYNVVPKGETRGSVSIIEGDHWETKNQYSVFVYYREKVPEYDRLVGYSIINSFNVTSQ